jgi:DNA recombination-dependent growth factor C
MKIQPFHRMIPMSLRALRGLVQNGYVADAVAGGAYARKVGEPNGIDTQRLTISLGAIGSSTPMTDGIYELACATFGHAFEMFAAKDPVTGQYLSYGFAPVPNIVKENGKPVYCTLITGTNKLLFYVEIRERVLPAISVSRKLAERIEEFTNREGREPNRKEVAMLKDQVKALLLKNAPVRPKQVPIIIDAGICYVFTSSQTQLEAVLALIRTTFGTWPVTPIIDGDEVPEFLRKVISVHDLIDDLGEDGEVDARFYPGRNAKLASSDSTTTIKDERVIDRNGYTTSYALAHGYSPVEADVHFFMPNNTFKLTEDGAPYNTQNLGDIQFKISDNGVIKKLAVSDLTDEFIENNRPDVEDDAIMTGPWYIARICSALLDALVEARVAVIADENDQSLIHDADSLDDVAMGLRNTPDDIAVLEEVEDLTDYIDDIEVEVKDVTKEFESYDPDLDDEL